MAVDLQPYVDFVLEVDRLKAVLRQTCTVGGARRENSAEHSWQIALLAAALLPNLTPDLTPELAPELDAARVVAMLLVHDLGEIDAGDALVYAEHDWAEHQAAERAGVQRVFGLLPPARRDHFLALWQEFEDAATPEARFAHAVDRAMPVLLNLANQGQSWRENGVSHARVVARIGPPIRAGCPALWDYLVPRLAEAQARGWFGDT